jgi:hypothetical protein
LVHTLFFPSGAYIGLSICFLKGPLAEDQYCRARRDSVWCES